VSAALRMRSERHPRLGFLGAGWIGRMRMKAVAASGQAEIAAIADPANQALSAAAAIAPAAEQLSDLSELLSRDLDGLVIATPSAQHASQAIASLNNGLAVFCQKPVGNTADDTHKVIDAACRADRLLATDFIYRFTAGMRAVHQLIRQGDLGRIYAAELCFHNSYGPDQSWYYSRSLSGGGCLIDLGIHLVDMALWALDFPPVLRGHARLFRNGRPFSICDTTDVEDSAFADLEADGGILIRLACSWRRPLGCDALIKAIFHGEKGAAEFQNLNGSFFDFRADHYWGREHRPLAVPPDDWGGRALLAWVARLSVSERFDPSAEQILRVAEVVDSIYKPSRTAALDSSW